MVRWPSSLRWRLTLLYAALFAIPMVALAIGFYALFARTLTERTDAFVGDALTAFSRELVAERRAAMTASDAIRSTVDEVRFRDLRISVLDSRNRVVAETPRTVGDGRAQGLDDVALARLASARPRQRPGGSTAETIHAAGGTFRVLSLPAVVGGDRFDLIGTYPISDTEAILARIRGVLVAVVPLLVLGGAAAGYFMAVRSLAPVSAMAERAAEITATSLRERVPVAGGEELARLARVMNHLLARLESAFAQQRRFMADASHELRTPTAILRTEADVALAQAHRSEDEYRMSLGVIRDAAARLTRVVDDLFALARLDAEQLEPAREQVYLEEIVDDALSLVGPLAEAERVRLVLDDVVEAPVIGNADLLGRLLLNLLDNAIKHSPEGGCVRVALRRRGAEIELVVIDEGRGIPTGEHERIFERFVRLDDMSSTEDAPPAGRRREGAGLGLAIARRIAESHGGTLVVAASRPGRTEFRLVLPAT